MRIYIAHSRTINYLDELYKPIMETSIYKEHEVIFPHLKSDKSSNTRDFYKTIDLVIAECSEPATGLGIELGWIYDDNKKIYCIYKTNKKISSSIKAVTSNIYDYKDEKDMLDKIIKIVRGEL